MDLRDFSRGYSPLKEWIDSCNLLSKLIVFISTVRLCMRNNITVLGLVLVVCFPILACSRPTGTEAPVLLSEKSSKLQEDKNEVMEAQKKSNADADELQKKIEQLELEMQRNQQMSASQRQSVEQELATLKQQKAEVDANLKAQAEKQAKLEEELRKANSANNNTVASNSNNGSSGFPFCGATYYGVTFQCGNKTCAKSDPNYQNICELTANSRPSAGTSNASPSKGVSGYPLCGDLYYGSEFTCNGQRCGKSDPNYANTCEITASSKSASTAASSNIGTSGYPFCPSPYYGSVFDCNGRKCAKSDSAYQNICEIR